MAAGNPWCHVHIFVPEKDTTHLKTRITALLLALLVVSLFLTPVSNAQTTSYASAAMYVRCASGALPALGYYQSTWQRDNGTQYFHDLAYNGVVNGYRAYSYVQSVSPGNYHNKVDSSGGYTTGWSGYKYVSAGYSIGWTYYRTVSC